MATGDGVEAVVVIATDVNEDGSDEDDVGVDGGAGVGAAGKAVDFWLFVISMGSLVVQLMIFTGADIDFGGSTTVTRNLECEEKLVGEQLFDDGGVIGDVPVSITRDT